jgi:hypothetical protein
MHITPTREGRDDIEGPALNEECTICIRSLVKQVFVPANVLAFQSADYLLKFM